MVNHCLERFPTLTILLVGAQYYSIATKFVMPQTLLVRVEQTLFIIQSIVAFIIFLFASQRETYPWAGWVSSGGLAMWTGLGIPLLIIHRRTLHQKLPWSVLIPLKFFFLFAGVPPSDLHQAGLLMPLSVNIGFICLNMYHEHVPEGDAQA